MKLIIVLLTTVMLQFGLAAEAQKITLSAKNEPLQNILKNIRQQTGYDFFCDIKLIKDAKKITIEVKNASLEEVLQQCLNAQNLNYIINDKIIVISSKKSKETTGQPTLQQDSLIYKGRVYDEKGNPMPGTTIRLKGTKKASFSTNEGYFIIYGPRKAVLIFSFVGYADKELTIRAEDAKNSLQISMEPAQKNLGEVNIVSTGYQDLPKERATGSFEVITKEQLQHSTDPNLLRRLEGITTSMDFNNQNQPNLSSNAIKRPILTSLTIRGRNSITRPGTVIDPSSNSGQPLVVIDGIATPYSPDNINPNDVESINILKDAAASSIWGSRAANGVIVIKTKRGSYNKPINVSFNTNINITDKIDLFYKKFMSTSDFIDAQVMRYNKTYDPNNPNAYLPDPDPNTNDLFQPQLPISPVEEIMNDFKMGKIKTEAEKNARLDALRNNDIRKDLDKYFLRKSVVQNYSLSIDGGSDKFAYRLSGGYNKTTNNTLPSNANRYTLNYTASVKPLKNLTLQAIVGYTQNNSKDQAGGYQIANNSLNVGFFPYTRLVDDQGNPISTIKNYRPVYLKMLADTYGSKILDMSFKPLQEMNEGYYKVRQQALNINLNADYKINPIFSAALTYSYNWGLDDQNELRGANSFYMRELINIYTTRKDYQDPIYGPQPLKKLIPDGGMYTPTSIRSNNQTFRGQLNANKSWNDKHQLTAIAGTDINQYYSFSNRSQYFGYNSKTLGTNSNVPFGMFFFRLINDPSSGIEFSQIPNTNFISDFRTRTIGFYSNAAYTYDNKYTLSASIRKDISNLFGEGTNKNGAIYYSLGGSWSVNNEKFYHLDWLPVLQVRGTFGYNGNVNAMVTAVPLIGYNDAPLSGGNLLPYVSVIGADNPQLRPEKSGMLNLGVNFGLKGNRMSGSMEYYSRRTRDLLANAPLDPSTGFNAPVYNSANLHGQGVDITLNSINLQSGNFRWTSNFLFSYNKVKITKLFSPSSYTPSQFVDGTTINIEGYDLSRLAAYRWAGLDPQTGDPMGYANGVPTRISGDGANYTALQASPISSTVRIFGSAVPVYYGSFRNTFSYAAFSLSANFLYKLGYYTRRPLSDIVRYDALFASNVPAAAEFSQRWQKPGDELTTNVPSLTYPTNFTRDFFYQNSEVNVIKGDHIRLQEINLAYTFQKKNWFIKNPRIYANVNNLGIVWRANKLGIDPEANDYPLPRSYSFGFSANF